MTPYASAIGGHVILSNVFVESQRGRGRTGDMTDRRELLCDAEPEGRRGGVTASEAPRPAAASTGNNYGTLSKTGSASGTARGTMGGGGSSEICEASCGPSPALSSPEPPGRVFSSYYGVGGVDMATRWSQEPREAVSGKGNGEVELSPVSRPRASSTSSISARDLLYEMRSLDIHRILDKRGALLAPGAESKTRSDGLPLRLPSQVVQQVR